MPGYWHSMFPWGGNNDCGPEWIDFWAYFPKHHN